MCIFCPKIINNTSSYLAEEEKKLHFVSPARRKSVLAPILNKIKNGAEDSEKKAASESNGHVAVQIEPAKKVKVSGLI